MESLSSPREPGQNTKRNDTYPRVCADIKMNEDTGDETSPPAEGSHALGADALHQEGHSPQRGRRGPRGSGCWGGGGNRGGDTASTPQPGDQGHITVLSQAEGPTLAGCRGQLIPSQTRRPSPTRGETSGSSSRGTSRRIAAQRSSGCRGRPRRGQPGRWHSRRSWGDGGPDTLWALGLDPGAGERHCMQNQEM